MKKILSALLTFAMLVSLFVPVSMTASATGTPKVTFESAMVAAGENVEVTLVLADAPDLTSLSVSQITFDESVFILTKAEWLVESPTLKSFNVSKRQGVVTFDEDDVNGPIAKLTFAVSASAEDDAYSITCSVSGKNVGTTVAVEVIPGVITVQSALPGDLDGDDVVTDADAIYLLYYTFFPDDYPVSQACDYDRDGTVTDADAIYLLS